MTPSKQWYPREPPIGHRYLSPLGRVEVWMGWIAPEPKPLPAESTAIVLRKETP